MTRQEIFDTVALHLIKQGRQAKNDDSCLYRAPDGSKCAFGILIPDDRYDPRMEGKAADCLIRTSLSDLFTTDDVELIIHLQLIHDGTVPWLDPKWTSLDVDTLNRRLVPDPNTGIFDIATLKEVLSILARNHNLSTECLQ